MPKIGEIEVPKEFEGRWLELLAKNRTMKAELTEATAQLTISQEQAATGASEALTTANARIAELEGSLGDSEWSTALAVDGIGGDADALEYLQYKYGAVEVEEGAEKPSVADWYTGQREDSYVVQAAIARLQAAGSGGKPPPKPAANGKPPVRKPARRPARRPPAPIAANHGELTPEGITGMSMAEFAENRVALSKELFGT